MEPEKILLTFLVCTAVGLALARLHIPAGMLVGALVGGWALAYFTHLAAMPSAAKFLAQIAAGAFIGTGLKREDLARIKTMAKPMATVIGSLLLLDLVCGAAIHLLCGIDLLTSFMCCVPGGMSDIPLIAGDMGADIAPIVVTQFARMVSGVAIFPSVIKLLCGAAEPVAFSSAKVQNRSDLLYIVGILLFSGFCGFLGKKSGFPAGTLVFAMAGALVFNLLGRPVRIPYSVKRVAQVLSGAYIGCTIGADALPPIKQIAVPVILVVGGFLLNAIVVGRLMAKRFRLDPREAMLMLTPAGSSDMALISSEIGVDSPLLILTQVLRVIIAVALFPAINSFICSLF